jgi:putative Mg2+ transporter-C (MgtC) family protein
LTQISFDLTQGALIMDLEKFLQALWAELSVALTDLGQALAPIFGSFDGVLFGRLLLTLLLCGLIGLERSRHERASGFRPHILVGLGACLMTMAGAYAFPQVVGRDPMRVASYVVSGIGFLGAGAILRHGATVRGLTTAASIWGAAGIGITTGVGLGWLATATMLLILFTLTVLERIETRLHQRGATNTLSLHLVNDHRAVGKALAALAQLGVPIRRATMQPAIGETAALLVELNHPLSLSDAPRLIEQLLTVKSIMRVDVTNLHFKSVYEYDSSLSAETNRAPDLQAPLDNLNQEREDEP